MRRPGVVRPGTDEATAVAVCARSPRTLRLGGGGSCDLLRSCSRWVFDWSRRRAFIDAFESGELDLEALRAFDQPVYFALGGRSNPDYFRRMAERLAAIFPDFTIETFPERHHFDPPHRIEPQRLANSLLALWQRSES